MPPSLCRDEGVAKAGTLDALRSRRVLRGQLPDGQAQLDGCAWSIRRQTLVHKRCYVDTWTAHGVDDAALGLHCAAHEQEQLALCTLVKQPTPSLRAAGVRAP